jgi:acyl dehydratase
VAPRISYQDVTEGEDLKAWSYHVARNDLVRYAKASGDQNPIHQDEEFAKRVGLPDVIAHGMHTMGKIGQYVTDWCGDPSALRRFRMRFTAMVVVPKDRGGSVTVSGSVAEKLEGNRVRLDVKAMNSEGSVAAIAEAIVELA